MNNDDGLQVLDWEPDETELVRELTAIVRKADADFESTGGTSRHWVRDHFLPNLRAAGWRIGKLPGGLR